MFLNKNDKSNDRQLQKLILTEPRLFARLADGHLHSGDIKKAAKTLVKGLQQFPDSVPGWLVKGMLHLKLKQPKLARAAFEKALTIDSEIPVAHHHSAELAQQEGDIDGYLNHLKALGALEPLDDNLQAMLQTAVLRQAAVAKGLFSQHQVERMMPGSLRQALLRANALPVEIARRTERFAFPPDSGFDMDLSPQQSTSAATPVLESPPSSDQPVWKDPKVKLEIARMEEADRERVVRVAWADALNNPSETPLVEIDAEQYNDNSGNDDDGTNDLNVSKEPSNAELRAEELRAKPVPAPALPQRSVPPPDSGLPPSMQKAMIKPYVPPPKPAPLSQPPPSSPVPERGKLETSRTPLPKTVDIESEWEGASPAQVTPSVRKFEDVTPTPPKNFNMESDWEGATPAQPPPNLRRSTSDVLSGGNIDPASLKRPRLTADIKLPAMRPLDADEEGNKREDTSSYSPLKRDYFDKPVAKVFDAKDVDTTPPVSSTRDDFSSRQRRDLTSALPKEEYKEATAPELPIPSETPPSRQRREFSKQDSKLDAVPEEPATVTPIIEADAAIVPELTPVVSVIEPTEKMEPISAAQEKILDPVIDTTVSEDEFFQPKSDDIKIELPKTPDKQEELPTLPPIVLKTSDINPDAAETPDEPKRPARNDSAIQRLLQIKKEDIQPATPPPPIPLVTVNRFEAPAISDDPPPPVSPPQFTPLKPKSTLPPPEPARIVVEPVNEFDDLEPYEPPPPIPEPIAPTPPLPSLRTRQVPTFTPPQPTGPPPKVNERLEVIDENAAPIPVRIPMAMPVSPPPPDLVAREEAVRQKLAAIVEEVTGKAPVLEAPSEPPAQEDRGPDYHLKGKIATKTLAELYASQGDWKRSADVYEVLLEKFPTNEAYKKRLESLKSKISDNP